MAPDLILTVSLGRNCSFFFQAEDGIRGTSVTGVQTCALPISLPPLRESGQDVPATAPPAGIPRIPRSEERRVGKESRAHKLGEQEKKKGKFTGKSIIRTQDRRVERMDR